jgi:hypothetical protein
MFDEELLRDQIVSDLGRVIQLDREYAVSLDWRVRMERKRLEGAVEVKMALLNGYGRRMTEG